MTVIEWFIHLLKKDMAEYPLNREQAETVHAEVIGLIAKKENKNDN